MIGKNYKSLKKKQKSMSPYSQMPTNKYRNDKAKKAIENNYN